MKALLATLLSAAGLFLSGCAELWTSIRENDRQIAIDRARQLASRGNCEAALVHLERGQAHPDLGSFAAESTFLKARCLDRVGRREEARAHWRLIRDFYADTRYAQWMEREPAGRDLDEPLSPRRVPAPPGLEIPAPRYSERAERARVIGTVWVEYDVPEEGDPAEIRVLQMDHPLLASWAIEAVANGRWDLASRSAGRTAVRATSRFHFVSYWAEQEAQATTAGGDGSATAPSGTEAVPSDGGRPSEPTRSRDPGGMETE